MNLFWVLAIGLTVLYVIYYAAIIMQELYGKKDDEQKTESENIEVPDSDTAEAPTVINETDDDPLFVSVSAMLVDTRQKKYRSSFYS